MTPDDFRKIALTFPGAEEKAHMGHPDFRAMGKIFASLLGKYEGVVKLRPDQQDMVMAAEPAMVRPANGAWGRYGWTHVVLAATDPTTAKSLLKMAWENVAGAEPESKGKSRRQERSRKPRRRPQTAAARR